MKEDLEPVSTESRREFLRGLLAVFGVAIAHLALAGLFSMTPVEAFARDKTGLLFRDFSMVLIVGYPAIALVWGILLLVLLRKPRSRFKGALTAFAVVILASCACWAIALSGANFR